MRQPSFTEDGGGGNCLSVSSSRYVMFKNTCPPLLVEWNTLMLHLVPGCLVGAKWQNSRVKKRPHIRWESQRGLHSSWDCRIMYPMVDPTNRKQHFFPLPPSPRKSKDVHHGKNLYIYPDFSFYLQSSKPNPCVNTYIQYNTVYAISSLKYDFKFGHLFWLKPKISFIFMNM